MGNEENQDKKEIRIVTGDTSDLNISKVSDHLNSMKPKSKEEEKKKNIVIPEVKKIEIEEDSENDGESK